MSQEDIKSKVDQEKLDQLIEICKKEYPHINDYFLYVYAVSYLLEQQDENISTV